MSDKKKIGIFSNYVWPHCGGSEIVIESICREMAKRDNFDINVFGFNIEFSSVDEKIKRFPVLNNLHVGKLDDFDVIWIYSDSFWKIVTVFENIKYIHAKIVITVVGGYLLEKDPLYVNIINENSDKIILTVHDNNTLLKLKKIGIKQDPILIPNGICKEEFDKNSIDFRKKYKIKSQYIVLNVSNFFFGKGQEDLPEIMKLLSKEMRNCVFVHISSSIKYRFSSIFRKSFLKQCGTFGINKLILENIPREDLIAAYKKSDLFLFTSHKEVAPLVILESKYAGLPWISYNVGDSVDGEGGKIIHCENSDKKEYLVPRKRDFVNVKDAIVEILNNKNKIKDKYIKEGKKSVENRDWGTIYKKYEEIFSG